MPQVDFSGQTFNGVMGVNGPAPSAGTFTPSNGNFGLISVSPVIVLTPVSIPFTLRLTFSPITITAAPVTLSGTLRGSLSAPTFGFYAFGGVIVAFDDKKTVAGQTVKIDFVDPRTSFAGRMNLTLPSVVFPPTTDKAPTLGGFFEIR